MKQESDISNYLDSQGRVKSWPSLHYRKLQRAVLEYLASKFETGKNYSEREVNDRLNEYHTFQDPALLRRELVGVQLLMRKRDGSAYWKPD